MKLSVLLNCHYEVELFFAPQSWFEKSLLVGLPPISDRMVSYPEAAVLLKAFMLKMPCVHSPEDSHLSLYMGTTLVARSGEPSCVGFSASSISASLG